MRTPRARPGLFGGSDGRLERRVADPVPAQSQPGAEDQEPGDEPRQDERRSGGGRVVVRHGVNPSSSHQFEGDPRQGGDDTDDHVRLARRTRDCSEAVLAGARDDLVLGDALVELFGELRVHRTFRESGSSEVFGCLAPCAGVGGRGERSRPFGPVSPNLQSYVTSVGFGPGHPAHRVAVRTPEPPAKEGEWEESVLFLYRAQSEDFELIPRGDSPPKYVPSRSSLPPPVPDGTNPFLGL
jgi:hypothetical protein